MQWLQRKFYRYLVYVYFAGLSQIFEIYGTENHLRKYCYFARANSFEYLRHSTLTKCLIENVVRLTTSKIGVIRASKI